MSLPGIDALTQWARADNVATLPRGVTITQEALTVAARAAGMPFFTTASLMNAANLKNGVRARVYADATAANNTIWVSDGSNMAVDTDYLNAAATSLKTIVSGGFVRQAIAGAGLLQGNQLPKGVIFAGLDNTPQGNAFFWVDDDFNWHGPYHDKLRSDVNDLMEGDGGRWAHLSVNGTDTLIASIWYGQSHAAGAAATPAISTTPLDYAKSYSTVRTSPAAGVTAVDRSALIGLVESDDAYGGGRGETGASGAALMLKQLLDADGVTLGDNGQYLMFSAPAFGGQSAASLSPGGAYFTAAQSDIESAVPLAAADKLFYRLMNIDFLQGEADASTDPQSYYIAVENIRAQMEAVAVAAQGFDASIPMILHQMSSNVQYGNPVPAIALKQLEMSLTSDNYAMACPNYMFPRNTSSIPHYTAEGSRWEGAYFGLAKYNWFWRGIKPRVLRPLSFRKQGKLIMQPFDVPVGKLQTYTSTWVPSQTNYGIDFVDASGDPLTVVSTKLLDHAIIFEFSATVPDGVMGRFGWNGVSNRPGVTNLRDEQAIVFHAPDGNDYTMFNHLVLSTSYEA